MAAAVIICTALSLTVAAKPLYYFDISHLDIPGHSGYGASICKLNYDVLIDYNMLGGEEELVFPTLSMSEEGRIHFAEVRDIFITVQWVSIVGMVAVVIGIFAIRRHGAKKENTLWLRLTGIVVIVGTALTAMMMLIDWQWAFETMHNVLFQNDYWLFDPQTDPVINILPDEFFFHCGMLAIIIAIVEIIAFELIYRRLNK